MQRYPWTRGQAFQGCLYPSVCWLAELGNSDQSTEDKVTRAERRWVKACSRVWVRLSLLQTQSCLVSPISAHIGWFGLRGLSDKHAPFCSMGILRQGWHLGHGGFNLCRMLRFTCTPSSSPRPACPLHSSSIRIAFGSGRVSPGACREC